MKHILRHIVLLTLTLCLLSGCISMGALAEEAMTYDAPSSMFLLDGRLCVSTYTALYFVEEDGTHTELKLPREGMFPSRATAWGNTLYVAEEGAVSAMTYADGVLSDPKQIADLHVDNSSDSYTVCNGLVADDTGLFVLMSESGMSSIGSKGTLYRLDLATGEFTDTKVPNITDLCDYKDGKLLGRQWDAEAYYSAVFQRGDVSAQASLVTIDKTTLAVTEVAKYPTLEYGGLAYDPEADHIYAMSTSRLVRFTPEGETEVCAYFSGQYVNEGQACVVLNGRFYASCYGEPSGFTSSTTDPALLPTRLLTVAENNMTDTLRAFAKAHPEIAVTLADDVAFSEEEIAQSMTAGSQAADVYRIYVSYGAFSSLRDKGYCVALNDSTILMDAVAGMYPNLTTPCYDAAGMLYALPSQSYSYTLGYSPSVLARLGLTEDDLPHTYGEMIDFLMDWSNDYASIDSSIALFDDSVSDIYSQLYYELLNTYAVDRTRRGEELIYNTPELRALLNQLDQHRDALASLNPSDDQNAPRVVYYSEGDDTPSLLTFSCSCTPNGYGMMYDYQPLLLTVEEGGSPTLTDMLSVLVINPNSANIDLAKLYLEFTAENMSAANRIALYPGDHEPVEDAYYQQNMKSFNESLANLEASLAEADDADKKELQAQIDQMHTMMDSYESRRWSISPEDITAYQALVPYMVVESTSLTLGTGSSKDVQTLQTRYSDGQINADQFLTELDRVLRMMKMENQ